MQTPAMLLDRPGRLSIATVALLPPVAGDVVVDVDWSGVSTGTERLPLVGRDAAVSGSRLSAGARL